MSDEGRRTVCDECLHPWERHTSVGGRESPSGCLDCTCRKKPTGTDALREAIRESRGGIDAPAKTEGWA